MPNDENDNAAKPESVSDETDLKFEPARIEWMYLANQGANIIAGFDRSMAESRQALMDSIAQSQLAEIQQAFAEATMWGDYSREVAEALEALHEAFQKFEAIGRYGWTIPMEASLPDIYHLADSIKDEATADAAFVHYFMESDPENLENLIMSVVGSPILDFWKPATEEAVACLREGKYRACVALLMPLVDGVCAKVFTVPHFEKTKQRQEFFKQKIQSHPDDSVVKAMWLSFIGFAETFFAYYDFRKTGPRPAVLNRHLLLHGRDIPQAKIEDCLRLFQALATIIAL